MTEVLAAILGSVLGVVGALYVASRGARRAERVTMTASLIAEYFSSAFLQHRIAIGNLSEKVRQGEVTFAEVSHGYWVNPGAHATYVGDLVGELNEHQHVEVYLGFVARLSYLLRVGRVYAGEVRQTLGMNMLWEAYLIGGIADACEKQCRAAEIRPPDWVDSFRHVQGAVIRLVETTNR